MNSGIRESPNNQWEKSASILEKRNEKITPVLFTSLISPGQIERLFWAVIPADVVSSRWYIWIGHTW